MVHRVPSSVVGGTDSRFKFVSGYTAPDNLGSGRQPSELGRRDQGSSPVYKVTNTVRLEERNQGPSLVLPTPSLLIGKRFQAPWNED